MKVIIPCAGIGKRLLPITYSTPKQLIPIVNKPLIYYTIDLLIKAGIKDICIVVNPNNLDIFKNKLVHFQHINITYITQENPLGIGDAILSAEEFTEGEPFLVILGDNIFHINIYEFINNYFKDNSHCKILLSEVENTEDYGVCYVSNGKVVNVIEKPKTSKSKLAITGLYMFDSNIFEGLREIKPSQRGEYEITDAIKWLIEKDFEVSYEIIHGKWRDIGKPEDVIYENAYMLKNIKNEIKGRINSSSVQGSMFLGTDSVLESSIIRGPVCIGKNTHIEKSYIGPYTSIGDNVEVINTHIENSILFNSCFIDNAEVPIDSSIIEEGSTIVKINSKANWKSFIIGRDSKLFL